VLGKLFDLTQLGYFSFAFQTVERFVELASTLSSAIMPSLTHLVARGERERMRWVFDQASGSSRCGGCAHAPAVRVRARAHALGGDPLFAPAVPLLRILALVPFARTAHLPLTMMFQAMRLPGNRPEAGADQVRGRVRLLLPAGADPGTRRGGLGEPGGR